VTREERPVTPPYALTIASTDSGGGAGIGADLKTMTRLGAYGGCVVVSVTAQHTRGVESTHVLPAAEVRAQFDAVADDVDVGAVKTGMLATEAGVRAVADRLAGYDGPVVVDPVMVATAGDVLLDPGAVDAYDDLFAQATLVTPNADEAAELTGTVPDTPDAAETVAADLMDRGCEAVLVKGGHVDEGGDEVRDTLVTAEGTTTFVNERVDTTRTHGSGCTLSSAIAARLAHGDALAAAVERAITFTSAALASPADVGRGPGSVNHLVEPTALDVPTVDRWDPGADAGSGAVPDDATDD
jgi:hydroxymethylpyrimidine/phosphomethylpyrimidine kinase